MVHRNSVTLDASYTVRKHGQWTVSLAWVLERVMFLPVLPKPRSYPIETFFTTELHVFCVGWPLAHPHARSTQDCRYRHACKLPQDGLDHRRAYV